MIKDPPGYQIVAINRPTERGKGGCFASTPDKKTSNSPNNPYSHYSHQTVTENNKR